MIEKEGNAVVGLLNGLLAMAWVAALIYAAMHLTGCGSSAGWNVSFGVHPVNAVSNNQTLNTLESSYARKADSTGAAQSGK